MHARPTGDTVATARFKLASFAGYSGLGNGYLNRIICNSAGKACVLGAVTDGICHRSQVVTFWLNPQKWKRWCMNNVQKNHPRVLEMDEILR